MHGVYMQVGPELELPGYGCEDHFQELDTVEHCWECIAGLAAHPVKLHAIPCMWKDVMHACMCFDAMHAMQCHACSAMPCLQCAVMHAI